MTTPRSIPTTDRTTMRLYLAGPMTGIHEFNFPAFDRAAELLRDVGHTVISPADLDRAGGFDETGCTGHEPLTQSQRLQFARQDIDALLKVDAVAVLPGWEKSTGARNETRIATMLGLKVYAYDPSDPTGLAPEWLPIVAEFSGKAERNARADILLGAEELVNGDRNAQYGDPRQDFKRTAAMWGAYLGAEIAAHDVAAMMMLLKASRIRWSPGKQDSWMDAAGYAACGWDCASEVAA